MQAQLSWQTLQSILETEDIAQHDFRSVTELFLNEKDMAKFYPDGICQVDPRNGDRVLFNSARARRPHDNAAPTVTPPPGAPTSCVVCDGKTTGVVDVKPQSEGFTFINKNLFPMVCPVAMDASPVHPDADITGSGGTRAFGMHFLQWTSSRHHFDWQNLALDDCQIALDRLGTLEETLLKQSSGAMPSNAAWGDPPNESGFVSIIKNYGRLVGGSLEHGHQQIAFSNIMPRRMRDNLHFLHRHGEPFSAYLLRENPPELLVRDYGPAVLLVPYFMRRPFDMILAVRNFGRRYLYELDAEEKAAVARGWQDGIRAMLAILPKIGRTPAYNVVAHNGPGAGLYFEFLPYTQETGGFEHLGLFVCQHNPPAVASVIRETLERAQIETAVAVNV